MIRVALKMLNISRKARGKYLRLCAHCSGHTIHRSICNDDKPYSTCNRLIQYWRKLHRRFGDRCVELYHG